MQDKIRAVLCFSNLAFWKSFIVFDLTSSGQKFVKFLLTLFKTFSGKLWCCTISGTQLNLYLKVVANWFRLFFLLGKNFFYLGDSLTEQAICLITAVDRHFSVNCFAISVINTLKILQFPRRLELQWGKIFYNEYAFLFWSKLEPSVIFKFSVSSRILGYKVGHFYAWTMKSLGVLEI